MGTTKDRVPPEKLPLECDRYLVRRLVHDANGVGIGEFEAARVGDPEELIRDRRKGPDN